MIGAGIWSTPGILAGQLGSAGMILLVWGVGAVCALAGAFCYSELGVNFPSSGGEYVYLTASLRPDLGIHDRLGLILRRLFGAHRGRGSGLLRLPRVFLSRVASGKLAPVSASGALSSIRVPQTTACARHRSVHHRQLLRRAAHGAGAERADLHQSDGDFRVPAARLRLRQPEAGAISRSPRCAPPPHRSTRSSS